MSEELQFTKLQSAGNDFVLLETAVTGEMDWPKLAKAMCRQHFGIGADGLLLLTPSDKASLGMRIFNSDGSEAEACGNGLRCLIKYAAEKGLVPETATETTVETGVDIRQACLSRKDGRVEKIQVAMGQPKLNPKDIPVALEIKGEEELDIKFLSDYPLSLEDSELRLSFVSMGNPHAIHFWQLPVDGFPLGHIGPAVENHQLFPSRVNFEVAQVLSRNEIEARVWERGVGETLACGTGACAIAVAGILQGLVDNTVKINLPGGTLEVEWDGKVEVLLSGVAKIVFTGQWPLKLT